MTEENCLEIMQRSIASYTWPDNDKDEMTDIITSKFEVWPIKAAFNELTTTFSDEHDKIA